jgi:fumarylacetoacetase
MRSRLSQNKKEDTTPLKPLSTWVDLAPDSDFSIYNIPFGVYRSLNGEPRCCTAIGDAVVDLSVLADNGYFQDVAGFIPDVFKKSSLNAFIALGKTCTRALRDRVIELLSDGNTELKTRADIISRAFVPLDVARMLMPLEVGDYTDFYSSKEHAGNIGSLLRDPKNPLLPNWKHLPVAYHGRASSIAVSGTPVIRPLGQFKAKADDEGPLFGPTQRLDYELELAFVIGKNSKLGERISVGEADDFIFGFQLFNDWSARDIQSWEYAPLGPFLSKNFLSSVSPWIVTTEALAPFKVEGPTPDILPLPYLRSEGAGNYDIVLEVYLAPEGKQPELLTQANFRHMYWNVGQQLAHHTVTGCNVKVGDLMASGTISGPGERAQGCLMELTRNGQTPLVLSGGRTRSFLQDGDTVIMKAAAVKEGIRVGFGEVRGTVEPAVGLKASYGTE